MRHSDAGSVMMVRMEATAWSLMTVVSWGVWLVPIHFAASQAERSKTLSITLGNLLVALLVAAGLGFHGLTPASAWPSLLGGVAWTISGLCAVYAVRALGIARAMGIWAPLNILVSIVWGLTVFGEFWALRGVELVWFFTAVLGLIAGVWAIIAGQTRRSAPPPESAPIAADGGNAVSVEPTEVVSSPNPRTVWLGVLGAMATGVGWGSYFIPIRLAGVSPWVAAFPMAVGMALMAACLYVIGRVMGGVDAPRRGSLSWLPMVAGVIWALGNYGSLQMMEHLGTGIGFTIAQACLVINASIGVFAFREPAPRSTEARWVLVGVLLVTAGAVALGQVDATPD